MTLEGTHGFWGDLHVPNSTPEQTDFTILGIPFDGLASARKGAALAPERIRYWSRHVTPFSEDRTRLADMTVCDVGDISFADPASGFPDVAHFIAGLNNIPIILGGDHSLALGSAAGAAAFAARQDRPLFLLWLDAHSDFHTPLTTTSGNLHGTPLAYIAGRDGFDAFPPFPLAVPAHRICMFGIRSVDPAEQAAMQERDIAVNDMRVIDERGLVAPLREFLDRVRAESGMLHVSLDVDFLDPSIAPAVGTTVPGGATFREAHLVMELLHESGLVTSLDLVELNPFLDDRGMTARLMVDLVGSLMGKKVFDRPTRSK